MAYYNAGEYIKKLRKQRAISQEQLAKAGKIGRNTLSRIENGKQNPDKATLDALLQRLGEVISPHYHFLMDDEEFEIYTLRDRLRKWVILRDTEQADALIAELERHPAFQQDLHKQFLLTYKAENMVNKGAGRFEPQEARRVLEDAIRMTIPFFNEMMVGSYILRDEELEIINTMANTYYYEQKMNTAIALLTRLADSIKRYCMDEREKAKSIALVHCNLSKYLCLNGQYEEALARCEDAIQLGIENGVYGYLPYLVYNKACALHYLGKPEECKKLLYQSYYSAQMMREDDMIPIIQKYAKERFGFNIQWL